jgi:excisionase family DNA binding protein
MGLGAALAKLFDSAAHKIDDQMRDETVQPMLLSVTQVAKLIGFSRTKTYEMVQAGKIPSIIVEGRTRITRKALDAWIEQQPRLMARASPRNF